MNVPKLLRTSDTNTHVPSSSAYMKYHNLRGPSRAAE